MTIDFDTPVDRDQTASVKHDGCSAYFGTKDVIPMWVADMDFPVPEQVTEALVQRAKHPVYGFTLYPDSMYQSMINWFEQRHHWKIAKNHIVMCPGVVPSLHAAIIALTEPGDQVIVQSPVYFPFFSAVNDTKRTLVDNELVLEDGIYRMDLAHLEQCAQQGAKLLILCSPHNPVGRVWQKQELVDLLAIARRYQMTIISDEIHADLIFPNYQHIPLASMAEDVSIITAVSPSKTFNIPGLGLSALVIDDVKQRKAIQNVFTSWHVSNTNPFSICAFEAAYDYGENWLDQLMLYLDETRDFVSDYLKEYLPEIKLIESQGTYLLWFDCRKMSMQDDDLWQFFIKKAKVGMNQGPLFGRTGSGFIRMNIACPRSIVTTALDNIKQALR